MLFNTYLCSKQEIAHFEFQRKWWEVKGKMVVRKSNGKRKTSEKEIDGSLVSGSDYNKKRKDAGRSHSQPAEAH